MAGMNFDIELAAETVLKLENWVNDTDEGFFKPCINAIENCGLDGKELEKVLTISDRVKATQEKIKTGMSNVIASIKNIIADGQGIARDQFQSKIDEKLQNTQSKTEEGNVRPASLI